MGGSPFPSGLPPELWSARRVLAVVAHPDDESFGLGAVLAVLVAQGLVVDLLCFTHGEASTVGAGLDLGVVRARELQEASQILGLAHTWLQDLPDGELSSRGEHLQQMVLDRIGDAQALVAFDPSGVTGHPDHRAATAAAIAIGDQLGIPTVEWGIAPSVAAALSDEMGVSLTGMEGPDVMELHVERVVQQSAIAHHQSQNPNNPFLSRRLGLQGDTERIRVHSAPYRSRLARLVGEVGQLARPGCDLTQRNRALDLLVGFAAGTDWPPDMLDPAQVGAPRARLLHDDPTGWTVAAVVLSRGGSTELHSHHSWGAAATILGVERNVQVRAAATNPSLESQLAPRGSGYVFDDGCTHRAADATGLLTAAVHLLSDGGGEAHQHHHGSTRADA